MYTINVLTANRVYYVGNLGALALGQALVAVVCHDSIRCA